MGCRKRGDDEIDQIGAAVGEMMASLDESSQGSASAAWVPALPLRQIPDELRAPAWRRAVDSVLPSAYAASCGESAFSACDGGVRTRTFDDCGLGLATLDGSVTLTFNRTAACAVVTDGDAVTRTANFTLTGLYGGTLAVSAPGGGQTLTRTAAGYEYTVGGMQRVLTGPGGRKLFDISTRTTAPIVVTGSSRSDLVIASGALEVSHNLAGYKVTLVPHNLTWTAGCNCATAGSLTGTVAGGRHDGKSATVEVTGCGEGEVTIDGDTDTVQFDRCVSL
jgi:hypothetical protein